MDDETIERALEYMRDKAEKFARAKSERVHLEYFRKCKKAMLMAEAEEHGIKTLGAQEVYAYKHPEYIALLEGLKVAVHVEEGLGLNIRSAQARIEIWRTQQANNRRERTNYGA